MPIKGITDRPQLMKGGHLRIGAKETKQRADGSVYEVPTKLDYFAFDPHDPALLPIFTEVYGPQPKHLSVLLPSDDQEQVFPHYYTAYKSDKLWCQGDGETAWRRDFRTDPPTKTKVPCNEECPFRKSRDAKVNKADKNRICGPIGTLRVILPDMPSLAVFEVKASEMSIYRILAGLAAVQAAHKRLTLIPLTLSVVPTTITKLGSAINLFVLELTPRTSLRELMERQEKPALPEWAAPVVEGADDEPAAAEFEVDPEPEMVADEAEEPPPEEPVEEPVEEPAAQPADPLFNPEPPAAAPAVAQNDQPETFETVQKECFALIEQLPETARKQPTLSMQQFKDENDLKQLQNFRAFLHNKVAKLKG